MIVYVGKQTTFHHGLEFTALS